MFNAQVGTCMFTLSDDKELVLHWAKYLLDNGFGCYHIFHNNCEDFAIYCKTGLFVVDRNMIGHSGQAASLLGAPLAAVVSPLCFVVTNPWGFAAVTIGVYCFNQYATDIRVRRDVAKGAVEDLAIHIGSSIVAEQPNATIVEQPNATAWLPCPEINLSAVNPRKQNGNIN